jgi:hypothetical protein
MKLMIVGNNGEMRSHTIGLFIKLAAEAEFEENKKKSEAKYPPKIVDI